MKKHLFLLPTLLLALWFIYKVESNAYIYAFLVVLIFCSLMIWLEKREKWKLFFIYITSVLLALFIGEVYFTFQNDHFLREYDLISGDDYIRSDSILGIVPVNNARVISRAWKNGDVVYEVNITIDEFGRRVMPKSQLASHRIAMFFGGSFTYGDGVEDRETLPYYFHQASEGQYEAYNFGFSGYGAHQTLAILENQLEARGTSHQEKTIGVYSIISDHVLRGTYSALNNNSPRYRLNEEGELYRDGLFSRTQHRFNHYLGKSNLVIALNPWRERPQQQDIDLLIAMLARSADIFQERYQGKFYFLLWETSHEEREGLYEKLAESLTKKGIEYIEVSKILPDMKRNPLKYVIKNDGHPNALANQLIGDYLVDLLSKP